MHFSRMQVSLGYMNGSSAVCNLPLRSALLRQTQQRPFNNSLSLSRQLRNSPAVTCAITGRSSPTHSSLSGPVNASSSRAHPNNSSSSSPVGGTAPTPSSSGETPAVATLVASLVLGGLLGGAGVGLDESLPESAQQLSAALGWSYFLAWSVSFWPQIMDNHRTRDVSGLSPDYLLFSLLGYICYGAYTGALYFSDDVRVSYATLHGGAMPDVSPADFAFAAHAIVATLIVSGQYLLMKQPGDKGLSPLAKGIGAVVVAACAGSALQISATCEAASCASWLPMLVLLGGIKVVMTLVKYTPQVLHNHRRRSTEGWNLTNVLLDLSGGMLSFSQVALDAAARHDLSVITGNPAKLWIAALSIGYDVIFVLQHYVLYKEQAGQEAVEQTTPGATRAVLPAEAAPRSAVLAYAEAGKRRGMRRGGQQQP